jgi:anthranilate/para-aminobenzoate synthase component I
MDIKDVIKQKLPENLWELAYKFTIPESFLYNDSELIILILKSKSIDKLEEKQNWFNLLSIMNVEQIQRLKDILTREKQKLEEIDQKYEQKKSEIKKKFESKFNENNYEKTINQLQEHENKHKEKEEQEAENLLMNI